jgi:hypothetical protein
MPSLSEAAGRPGKKLDPETVKRVDMENASVADVTPPPWTKKRTLGAQKKKG